MLPLVGSRTSRGPLSSPNGPSSLQAEGPLLEKMNECMYSSIVAVISIIAPLSKQAISSFSIRTRLSNKQTHGTGHDTL